LGGGGRIIFFGNTYTERREGILKIHRGERENEKEREKKLTSRRAKEKKERIITD